jgi:hypothetical protein
MPSTQIPEKKLKEQIKIVKVGVAFDTRSVVIKLPIAAARYLNIDPENKDLFAVPVNGVVQLSNFQPNITIPVSRITEDDFETNS